MRSTFFNVTIATWLVALLAGCAGAGPSKTKQDTINEYKAQFDTQRQKLQAIAQALPPEGSVQDAYAPLTLDTKPIFDMKNQTFNTEVVMFEQLLDPDVSLSESQSFEVYTHGDLLHCIQWTGAKNPLTVTDEPADERFTKRFQDALNYRYLVALRVIEYTPPVALTEQTFRGGSVTIEAFLVDLPSSKLLTAFRFSAKAAPDVYARLSHIINSKETPEERVAELESLAHSSLKTDMDRNLSAILAEITGGTFYFDLA